MNFLKDYNPLSLIHRALANSEIIHWSLAVAILLLVVTVVVAIKNWRVEIESALPSFIGLIVAAIAVFTLWHELSGGPKHPQLVLLWVISAGAVISFGGVVVQLYLAYNTIMYGYAEGDYSSSRLSLYASLTSLTLTAACDLAARQFGPALWTSAKDTMLWVTTWVIVVALCIAAGQQVWWVGDRIARGRSKRRQQLSSTND